MKRLFPVLLLALLLFGSLQDSARAASTPPEKTASGSPGENPNKHATFNPVLTIQLQRDAAMWGDGTVLDVDVGPNLYAYVRQNPWSSFDPHGLTREDPDGFKWKGDGHHIVPASVGRDTGLGKEAKAVFDDLDNKHGSRLPTKEHGYNKHGHYNREVAAEWAEYATKHAPDGVSNMSAKKQTELAKGFVEHIQNTDNPYIKGFNQAAHNGTKADVDRWYKTTGKNIVLKSTGKKAGALGKIKIIQGIAKTAKVGSKLIVNVPVIGGVLIAGAGILEGKDSRQIARDVVMSESNADMLEGVTYWVGKSAINHTQNTVNDWNALEGAQGDADATLQILKQRQNRILNRGR